MLRHFIAGLIAIYQRTLSPDHSWVRSLRASGCCRYYPTCSEYSRTAVLRYGVLVGLGLSARRLLRCHPWATGGSDPVPAEIPSSKS